MTIAKKNIPLESTFADFIRSSGGSLVSDLVSNTNPPKNADYIFRQEDPAVIAELKSLEKDSFTPEYGRKVQQLADSWMARGLFLAFGRVQLRLRELHPICQQEWLRLLEGPLQKNVIGAANEQIRDTRNHLNLRRSRGIVFIATNGNYSLQPHDTATLVSRILQKPKPDKSRQYRNIDAVVLFSLNVTASVLPQLSQALFWIPLLRDIKDDQLNYFIRELQTRWGRHLNTVYGQEIPTFETDGNILEKMRLNRS
jgi:hypothetical protein